MITSGYLSDLKCQTHYCVLVDVDLIPGTNRAYNEATRQKPQRFCTSITHENLSVLQRLETSKCSEVFS